MTGSQISANEMRDRDIYEKRMNGMTGADLSAEYGLSEQRISQICREVRSQIPSRTREELIQLSLDRLEDLHEKVLEIAAMRGAPVTAGQLGEILRDPESGEVVRDQSAKLRAIDLALKMNATLAKRLGLDAPAQTESVVKAAVQYEIVGVDPEALT